MTVWLHKDPGELGELGDPDWVRLPPELGGGQVRVTASAIRPCPKCGAQGRHLLLEHQLPDGRPLAVGECDRGCGFSWYAPAVAAP